MMDTDDLLEEGHNLIMRSAITYLQTEDPPNVELWITVYLIMPLIMLLIYGDMKQKCAVIPISETLFRLKYRRLNDKLIVISNIAMDGKLGDAELLQFKIMNISTMDFNA